MIFPRWPDDAMAQQQEVILTPISISLGDTRYTALLEVPIQSETRTADEVTLVGGQPKVVADVVRAASADTSDFIDSAIERSKRERGITVPALVAGGFENWRDVTIPLSF